ncbi:MAG: PKD domain-containing protein [Candidatus Thiodiazotropha taylori]|nr:PKD domain-containing protein [Candidatus Thiodiazotropha taylori]MCG7918612.1 PKD domain-containing protein [Candidatus Thiodiazotropha taylori]MCG7925749.1 PKD domain-containing protein [Candidatus Thiodiazotropha taylori]MCG7934156.1 PKD domain-containing protein [Candidatus Thiodiazotropha taylori]MCG7969687.1 PKD domain-containing protein [Candidatus Thiodiazotropha taylori]
MNRLSFQMLSIVVLVLLSSSVAIGADFKIEKALWKAEKSLLIVKATADIGQRLRIENAYDSTQVLKESKLRKKETLTSRVRSPEQLPCRIRVVNLTTDRELEQDVKSSDTGQIPQGCSPTGPSEPPVNKAPVADAGIDQLHQLQAGQTSMTVTLDGSGSSDPDGKVADYIWTGSPDPADVVSPSISLNEGTHKFSLIVVDDQGESSASDAVLITVEAAPVEPPPPPANEEPVADAGADQTHQLQVGQSSLTVTLNGSGSMDPDGSVVSYVWDGSPNPADTASPSVTLAEGSYEFTLMVEDNLGEISAPDSVWITVNAPATEPPATAAEAHASIVIYEGPSTCISCHEDEAVAMHGSVHYQQSGDTINLTNDVTPFSSSGLPRAGERGDGAIGINTYCGSHLNSPRFTCAGCHVGNGRFPNSELPLDETERQAELSNIDCLMCHQDTYKRFPSGDFEPLEIVEMGTDGKPDPSLPPIVRTGSQGIPVVDPVTLDFEFEPADANSTLVDLGGSPMMQDRVSAAQSVHATTRKSCLNCHAKAGGGDGTKRGDLSSALIDPAPSIDIHMSSSGENLSCADCHDAGGHRVKGRGLDLRPNDVPEHFTCESCHDQPHGDYSNRNGGSRDKHATRVACQTCHIPTYAKGVPTETNRDWEDPHFSAAACNGRGGWLPREDKALNLTPTYHWFDGTSQVYVLGEDLADYPVTVLEDGSDAITLGLPNGWVNKQNAKIYPMKEHTSKSAVHDASNSLIAHSTFEFFRTGSFDTAVQHALEQTGRSGDSYSVKKVHTFQTLNHGVEASSAALECGACHASLSGGPLRMDLANDLGYGMKGKEAEVCTQCHENKGSMSFSKIHEKHVKDKGYDCSTCHEFSRPERGLNTNIAQFVED